MLRGWLYYRWVGGVPLTLLNAEILLRVLAVYGVSEAGFTHCKVIQRKIYTSPRLEIVVCISVHFIRMLLSL